jgi:hypothetical protein
MPSIGPPLSSSAAFRATQQPVVNRERSSTSATATGTATRSTFATGIHRVVRAPSGLKGQAPARQRRQSLA